MPKNILLPFKSSEFTTDLSFLDAISQEGGSNGEGAILTPMLQPKKKNKIKYTCPNCKANVWGKPELEVFCKTCIMEQIDFYGVVKADSIENFTMLPND